MTIDNCFIFTYCQEIDARNGLNILIDCLKKDPNDTIRQVKLGKCKVDSISGYNVIEPYWLIVTFPSGGMIKIDDWICKAQIPCDDLYSGRGRALEFESYTTLLRSYDVVDGNPIERTNTTIEWE